MNGRLSSVLVRLGRSLRLAAMLALVPASLSGQGLGLGVAPDVGQIRWSDGIGLSDATLFGAQGTVEFGRFVRLQAGLRRSESVDVTFEDLAVTGADNQLDLWMASTGVLFRGGDGRIAPLLAGSGGVMRFTPEGREDADQIFVGYGGGLGFRIQDWLEGRILVQDVWLRTDRSLFSAEGATVTDPDANDTRSNLYASLGLGVRLGGQSSNRVATMDRDFGEFLRGGADGLMIPIGLQVGAIRFDDALDVGELTHVGVRGGFDFGSYFGVRGSYWRGFEESFGDFSHVQGWTGEAQFNLGRVTQGSTFLTLGYGEILFGEEYLNESGLAVPDQNAFVVGAGFGYPLLDRVRLVASVRDHITTSRDLDETAAPSDLRHSPGVEAGLSYRLWGGARSGDAPLPVPPPAPTRPADLDVGIPVRPATQADSIAPAALLAADSVGLNYQSDRTVTIPIPAVGELYIRYGPVEPGSSRFGPATPGGLAPADSLVATLLRDELDRIGAASDSVALSRSELVALEGRLIDRLEARLAAGGAAPRSDTDQIDRLEAQVRELADIVRDGLAMQRAGTPMTINLAQGGTIPVTGVTQTATTQTPFFRGIEGRLGTASVRDGGPGVGGSVAVSLGSLPWSIFRPFVSLEAGRTSVETRLAESSVFGSVTGVGATVGSYLDIPIPGRFGPALSAGLAALGGPVSGDTPQDEELMELLYSNFAMGPEVGMHLAYQRPGTRYQVTGGLRRLWAGSRSRWALEAGMRLPRGGSTVTTVAPAPLGQGPLQMPAAADSVAMGVDPVAPMAAPVSPAADPELLDRLQAVESALSRETSARAAERAAEIARADSIARALAEREREVADAGASREALREAIESIGVSQPDIAAVRGSERGLEIILGGAMFPVGSADLTARSRAAIGLLGARLRAESGLGLLVEGHTDDTGDADYNLRLSLARAESVRLGLIASGFDPDRIIATGSGESVPIADNGSSDGRAANRRVEVVVLGF